MFDRKWIEKFGQQKNALSESIAGLNAEQLRAFPVPKTWSIQQIVWHIVDSDLVLSDRMKRIIAEDRPTLIGFDETAFAERLHYHELDAAQGCKLFELNRTIMTRILEKLTDADFERIGVHNERGEISLGRFVQMAVEHVDHHLKFVSEKRKLLGA